MDYDVSRHGEQEYAKRFGPRCLKHGEKSKKPQKTGFFEREIHNF